MNYPSVILKKDKEKSIERKHPWVFSGAIQKIVVDTTPPEPLTDGQLVNVFDENNNFLATGHFQDGTIAVRIISFTQEPIDDDFWFKRLTNAFELRKALGLTENLSTNIYRLIHAEGDQLPGLIIDFYNGTAVIQSHSAGMHFAKPQIVAALQKIYGKKLLAIYDKSAETLEKQTDLKIENGYLYQTENPELIGTEYDCNYHLDWVEGQKTGFFIDQRENRKLLGELAKDKLVLNTFCYSGGFSVAALKNGAKAVHSVDSSKKAIELTDKNIELNQLTNHQSFVSDTLTFLKENKEIYDIIVLDPPAYAKHRKSMHKAVQGYKRLNEMALKNMKSGGLLFTFSCSQVINRKLFYDTIMAAAISSQRNVRVLYHLSQPADHPVNIFHPEGEYLKGLVLWVE
jgi:23S rRNA (cytosine1962-C5)-methyltransferase